MSYIFESLSSFGGGSILNVISESEESDDPKLLPPQLVRVYKNPYRSFGLDESTATIAIVRDSFRKACLSFTPHFSGLGKPKMTLKQLVFAYHLVRQTLKGPASKLKEILLTSPCMDFNPDDILPLLRPIRSEFDCPREYRGFRMLTIDCVSTKTTFSYVKMPRTVFVFDIHYCLRRHTVEHDFEEVNNLSDVLARELLIVPGFPKMELFQLLGLSDSQKIGQELAKYMMRVHLMLANVGMFSARLLKFLNIDFEKVQSEEEGAIMALLDTPNLPKMTVWHMIDEGWLKKWRKFVMGRGARRYFPPGKITNRDLIERFKSEPKGALVLSVDYRAVNYNVYRFYELVHGGGPNISRKEENIYSPRAISHLQAAILLQSRIRIFISKCRREALHVRQLSGRNGAKGVIMQAAMEDLRKKVETKIERTSRARKQDKLANAVKFTQTLWRNKKKYVPEENLLRRKKDQEVFARTKSLMDDGPVDDDGAIVYDVHPIVKIGNASMYHRTITEESGGIPFKVMRLAATQTAIIAESSKPDEFILGSKIISINSFPSSSMDFLAVKQKLADVAWPIVLELERPLAPINIPSLDAIVALQDSALQYNAFKVLLANGLPLIKWNSGNTKSHLTTIKLTANELLYRSKNDPRKSEDELWNKISLFQVKYVERGTENEIVRKVAKSQSSFDAELCVAIVTEERVVVLEVPEDRKLADLLEKEALAYQKRFEGNEVMMAKREARRKEEASARDSAERLRKKYIVRMTQMDMTDDIESSDAEAANAVGDSNEDPEMRKDVVDDANPTEYIDLLVDGIPGLEAGNFLHPEYKKPPRDIKLENGNGVMKTRNGQITMDEFYLKVRAATVLKMFNKLVDEIRTAQIHVDNAGVPTKRTVAKKTLRKV